MSLRDDVIIKIRKMFPDFKLLSSNPCICKINNKKINIRTANKKSGDKYWFDVTPEFYERKKVDFLLYSCGNVENIYIFPVVDFSKLIEGASLGGSKQVPNFTIFLDNHVFEPAGKSHSRSKIRSYYNGFNQLIV